MAAESDLAKKLNLKPGMKIRVVGQPADVNLAGVATGSAKAQVWSAMRFRPKK